MQRTLGAFIKEKRESLGLNQTELANLSGVPRETINRIENNKTQLPFSDSRRRLAMALNVRHVDLLVAAGELTEDEINDVAPLVGNDPDVDIIAETWEFLDRGKRQTVLNVVRGLAEASPDYDVGTVEQRAKAG